MKTKAALLLSVVLIVGCDYSDDEFVLGENNFFPLQIGNYWELHAYGQNPVDNYPVLKMEITATESFSGVEYYLMVTKSEGVNGDYIDSVYYRTDQNGFVHQRLKTGEIRNPYRLGASNGVRWRSSGESTEKDMKVTYYTDPIEIGSTQLSNCRLFTFDMKEWIDEEHYTTLAPDIGVVTMHSAWGFRKDLKKAIINGIEYNF
jgi:hypothetical protein